MEDASRAMYKCEGRLLVACCEQYGTIAVPRYGVVNHLSVAEGSKVDVVNDHDPSSRITGLEPINNAFDIEGV